MMKLAGCRDVFHCDGSLRDIYVGGTTEQDWGEFWSFLQDCGHALSYSRDGVAAPVPSRVSDLLRDASYAHLLSIDVSGVAVHCHCFTADEIELDVDPREVTTQAALDGLLGFMQSLGDRLGKGLALTEEMAPERVLLRYCPSDGGWRRR